MSPGPAEPVDIAIVGGGLHAALLALALAHHSPGCRVALFERSPRLAGNHTWCFHPHDVPAAAMSFIEPLIAHRWDGYRVRFPGYERTLTGGYAAVTSESLARVVAARAAVKSTLEVHTDCDVVELHASHVRLADGRSRRASLVFDMRGPERSAASGRCGFQKFIGLEVELERPHGLCRPLLMDATVAQTDGYRFMYVLPFSPTRLLVEDTGFSRSPALASEPAHAAIKAYTQAEFGPIAHVAREERGLLPMTFAPHGGEPSSSPVVGGYRGGWFHPATGYSFPVAVRFAERVARSEDPCKPFSELGALWREHRVQARFAERLNWLLFHAFEPQAMWHVFRRFYRLPEPLVHRFYAMQTCAVDRARILVGRPPEGFSLSAALAARRAS